jgi:hypothetical protein
MNLDCPQTMRTEHPDRGILTIAFGSENYIQMALALGRSLRHSSPGLLTSVVTDRPESTFSGIFDYIIPIKKEYGADVIQKLFIDQYSPFHKTLFIDCDSLVFGGLESVFDGMSGGSTIIPDTVYTHCRKHPKPGLNFDVVAAKTGMSELPGFNGGVYYIERGTNSEQIFLQGREILKDYASYGIGKFRSGPNDENVLSVSMALTGFSQRQMPMQVMRETFGLDRPVEIDVLRGRAQLSCYGILWNPVVVHFCSGWHDCGEYRREMRVLALLHSKNRAIRWSAPIYSTWLQVCLQTRAFGKKFWNSVPRPIRLLFHAVHTRVRRLRLAVSL